MEGLLTQEEFVLKVAVKTMKSEQTVKVLSNHYNESLHLWNTGHLISSLLGRKFTSIQGKNLSFHQKTDKVSFQKILAEEKVLPHIIFFRYFFSKLNYGGTLVEKFKQSQWLKMLTCINSQLNKSGESKGLLKQFISYSCKLSTFWFQCHALPTE